MHGGISFVFLLHLSAATGANEGGVAVNGNYKNEISTNVRISAFLSCEFEV